MILFIFLLCLILQTNQLSCSNPPIFIPFQTPTCFTEATYDTEDPFNNNTIEMSVSGDIVICNSPETIIKDGNMVSNIDFEQRLIEMNTTKYTFIFPFQPLVFIIPQLTLDIKIGTTLHIQLIATPSQYSIQMLVPVTPLMTIISPAENTRNYIHVTIDGTSVSATITKYNPIIATVTTSGTLLSPISGVLNYTIVDGIFFQNHQVHDRLLSPSEIVDFGTTTFLDFSSFGISNFKCSAVPCVESEVCSGHGSCFGPDQCVCDTGYIGSNCELHTCSGISFTDCENVCSGHGSCTSPNTCTCEIGYEGSSCEVFSCTGLLFNNTEVCSEHGSCIDSDICDCDGIGVYFGDNCENVIPNCTNVTITLNECLNRTCPIPITCFGKNATTTDVCSSHGRCTSQDICSCSDGYSGLECNTPICTLPCQNDGNCTAPDICSCTVEYEDEQCQTPICSPVCSPFTGTCINPNTCMCDFGYNGSSCTIPLCPSCVHEDTCYLPGMCTCESGWHGINCDIPECNRHLADNDDVCLGRGNCTHVNNCTCDPGYSGINCELFSCFGISSLNSSVCHNNGKCTKLDCCKCDTTGSIEYTGEQCENNVTATIDFFINQTIVLQHLLDDCEDTVTNLTQDLGGCTIDAMDCQDIVGLLNSTLQLYLFPICIPTCSVNGECQFTGFENLTFCNCNQGWEDTQCSTPICQHTCINGNCVAPGICTCDIGWGGGDCDIPLCLSGCMFGSCIDEDVCDCDIYHEGSACNISLCNPNCTSHGVCTDVNQCTCDGNFTGVHCEIPICNSDCVNGICIEGVPNICSCTIGWMGDDCNTPICDELCQNGGHCTSPNVCTCENDFFGVVCENQTGCLDHITCFGISENDTTVCHGHGECVDQNICSCEGGWGNCSCSQVVCNPECVHGSCEGPNICICEESWEGLICDTVIPVVIPFWYPSLVFLFFIGFIILFIIIGIVYGLNV